MAALVLQVIINHSATVTRKTDYCYAMLSSCKTGMRAASQDSVKFADSLKTVSPLIVPDCTHQVGKEHHGSPLEDTIKTHGREWLEVGSFRQNPACNTRHSSPGTTLLLCCGRHSAQWASTQASMLSALLACNT